MPSILADDGVRIHYEEAGSGIPIVFVHEFGGDFRSHEAQLRWFSRRYRCVAFNARGFPPSDVPDALDAYSQERSVADLLNVMDALGISRAHLVGVSMGSFTVLHFALAHPERTASILIAAWGYGVDPEANAAFRDQVVMGADFIRANGMPAFAEMYSQAPTRVQLENKDPRGFAEFKTQLAQRSAMGAELTMRGVQFERDVLDGAFLKSLEALAIPTLIVTGDEDEPSLEPSLKLKRTIRTADLVVLPGTGHTLHLEEPDAFNRHLGEFLHQVEAGRWRARDPRTMKSSVLGVEEKP